MITGEFIDSLIDERYELQARIGSGIVCSVYRVLDVKTGELAAMKVFAPGVVPGEKSLEYLLQQFATRATIKHPNISTILDYGVCQLTSPRDVPYLVIEYIEGETLRDRLLAHAERTLRVRDILSFLGQVAERKFQK